MKNENNPIFGVFFSRAYSMLPAANQGKIREEIMTKCGWESLATFYSKKDGKVKIRKTEAPVIEQIFMEQNIDAWTGEYIKQVV